MSGCRMEVMHDALPAAPFRRAKIEQNRLQDDCKGHCAPPGGAGRVAARAAVQSTCPLVLRRDSADGASDGVAGRWLWIGPEMIHLMELPNPDPMEGRPEHGGRDRHVCVGLKSVWNPAFPLVPESHQ